MSLRIEMFFIQTVVAALSLGVSGCGVGLDTLFGPSGVTYPLTFVTSDFSNNRVLLFNGSPSVLNQPANIVLGQPDFVSNTANNGGISAASLSGPYARLDSHHLFVADGNNNRVLIWNSIPTTNEQPADLVLGQPDMVSSTANNGGVSAHSFNSPSRIFSDGTRLYVGDGGNSRVLIWNSIPTVNNQPADLVLGQPDFVSNTSNNGGVTASSLRMSVHDIWSDGTRLFISDGSNNRILIWNTFPTVNGQAANAVLGQTSVSGSSANNGGAANGLSGPNYIYSDGVRFYASEQGNNRMLIWNSIPSTTHQLPDVVVGQPDMSSTTANNGGIGAQTLNYTKGVYSDGTRLYVGDANNRVLIWNKIPTQNFQAADLVLGQVDFVSTSVSPVTSQSLSNPSTIDSNFSFPNVK